MIPKKIADFIIAVTGNRIECEGERQKYSKYIIVFRVYKTHKKMIPKKIADFIIAVTGNRIECELHGVGTCSVLRV